MTEVIMPKMGDGMEEGTLVEWLKKEGDKVKSGEVIGTIQTDKATLELESPGSGTLTGLLIKGGETVPVGRAIAAIVKEGESLPEGWSGSAAGSGDGPPAEPEAPQAPREKAPEAAKSAPAAPKPEAGEPVVQVAGTMAASAPASAPAFGGGRVKVSPLARKVASERGVDLAAISGSGPGGRIIEKDVEAAAASPRQEKAPAAGGSSEERTIPLGRLRRLTAERTAQSKQQVPHYYVTVEADVERIMALREMFEEEESGKVSINDFVVKACALALRDMPVVNSVFQGQSILQPAGVHVGIAVAIEEGLTVAVIKNADQLGLREIGAKSRDLVARAKESRLSMDELGGSTFSISNMGMLDVDNFLAIINQPNSAILAVSSARKKVVPNDEDEIEIRRRMNITCSFDHRVVDGAVGAEFINAVRQYLENPTRLLG